MGGVGRLTGSHARRLAVPGSPVVASIKALQKWTPLWRLQTGSFESPPPDLTSLGGSQE